MDLLLENSPESCSKIGLDCGSCIHRGAASVASVCRELEPGAIRQIFLQMYPSPSCHAMAEVFALAYQESSIATPAARAFAIAAA
ncbi:MAG TPA: hypothetical protein VKX49_17195 [Bryobacteraceae bacterium]|nr:hypothetical protein [Bryobacteraceae bacterium]